MSSNFYDIVPYGSFAYPRTHISHLHTVGRLFGLTVPSYKTARVLEIGCASGGNIIPMALQYPNSQFVGIDIAKSQIMAGQKTITELGLSNITLREGSIEALPNDLGKFDYIICHGVFSWVPDHVRTAILREVRDRLSADGLAVVSYNVLPGWGHVQTLREMMLFHCRNLPTPEEKVAQARALLRFIKEAHASTSNAYSLAVEHELMVLESNPDWYVFHDHLESDNKPFFFHQFIEMAGQFGLGYVGDADLTAMFLDNAPPTVVETLKGVTDPIQLEQYLDFAANRRFRSTILCHAGRTLSRTIDGNLTRQFYIQPAIDQVAIDDGKQIFSQSGTGRAFVTDEPATIAALKVMLEISTPLSFAELVGAIVKASSMSTVVIEAALDAILMRMTFAGLIRLTPEPPLYAVWLKTSPKTLPLVRIQLGQGNIVVNGRHETLQLPPISARILSWLDGTHSREDVIELASGLVANGEFFLEVDGKPIATAEERRAALAKTVDSLLSYFLAQALLEP
ncbi:methyltransferase regulatory domain-containing protein [Magnetospirillum sp. SS-4]|uniref:methyltransferase regulatory domain-containing protein n=1 Tax=Magnetospirillum sp. SS-4 TaxID=2681465 RepID=UPI00137E3055|nr:class I SAM-dependent methyltransferase [Magnetospirillum sp. SS-4]CAA7624570.1 conserved hypothetical protein [Magnetospirillum sp. SS-4]